MSETTKCTCGRGDYAAPELHDAACPLKASGLGPPPAEAGEVDVAVSFIEDALRKNAESHESIALMIEPHAKLTERGLDAIKSQSIKYAQLAREAISHHKDLAIGIAGVATKISTLTAELATVRADVSNAVSEAKKYAPDYPWDGHDDASIAVWALGQSLVGVKQASDELRARAEKAEAEVARLDGLLTAKNIVAAERCRERDKARAEAARLAEAVRVKSKWDAPEPFKTSHHESVAWASGWNAGQAALAALPPGGGA